MPYLWRRRVAGRVKIHIDRVFTLDEVRAALALVCEGRALGKVVSASRDVTGSSALTADRSRYGTPGIRDSGDTILYVVAAPTRRRATLSVGYGHNASVLSGSVLFGPMRTICAAGHVNPSITAGQNSVKPLSSSGCGPDTDSTD